jgi:hypothetical protein
MLAFAGKTLGFSMLGNAGDKIDYRDGLVDFIYDPIRSKPSSLSDSIRLCSDATCSATNHRESVYGP